MTSSSSVPPSMQSSHFSKKLYSDVENRLSSNPIDQSDDGEDDDDDDDTDSDDEEDASDSYSEDESAYVRQHGLGAQHFSVDIEVHQEMMIEDNEDTADMICVLRDTLALINNKFLPDMQKWMTVSKKKKNCYVFQSNVLKRY